MTREQLTKAVRSNGKITKTLATKEPKMLIPKKQQVFLHQGIAETIEKATNLVNWQSRKSQPRRPGYFYKKCFRDLSSNPAVFTIPEKYRTKQVRHIMRLIAKYLSIRFDKEKCALVCTTRRGLMRAFGYGIRSDNKIQNVFRNAIVGHRISWAEIDRITWVNENPGSYKVDA